MSVRIAKIDRICPISGNIEYSLLDESAFSYERRQPEHHTLMNATADEAEERICKKHKVSVVSEEDFNEFLSLFQQEDEERIARQAVITEEKEKEIFYSSLKDHELQFLQDHPQMSWKEYKKILDDAAFEARYHTPIQVNPFSTKNYIWNPGR